MNYIGPSNQAGAIRSSATAGQGATVFVRALDFTAPPGSEGFLLVQSSPTAFGQFSTRLRCYAGGTSGTEQTRLIPDLDACIPWAGERIVLEIAAPVGVTISAVAGWGAASNDIRLTARTSGTTISAGVVEWGGNWPVTERMGLLAIGARVFAGPQTTPLGTGSAQLLGQDDAGRLVETPYSVRQFQIQSAINAAVLGIAGTATLVAAPGANLQTCIVSLSGSASAPTTLTIESPAAAVLFTFQVVALGQFFPMTFVVPVRGVVAQAVILRTSAAATISAFATGFTERAA